MDPASEEWLRPPTTPDGGPCVVDMRFAIFRANLKRIEGKNKNSHSTFYSFLTPYADWTESEFQSLNRMRVSCGGRVGHLGRVWAPIFGLAGICSLVNNIGGGFSVKTASPFETAVCQKGHLGSSFFGRAAQL